MTKNTDDSDGHQSLFGNKEKLQLHQLRLLEWNGISVGRDQGQKDKPTGEKQVTDTPEKWCLTRGIDLYGWQKKCMDRWFKNGCKGTVKVVTGGGKTVLGLAIAERLQNEKVPELRVAIVVPTIVLMNQWYDELLESGNLPAEAIARTGGGYHEDFDGGTRVLISVLVSASKKLPDMVQKAGVAESLLLIVDECHRAGSKEKSRIFETKRGFNLGLSATPEREEDGEQDESSVFEKSLLGQQLGSIIYDFNLIEALKLGIVPSYTILHYGLGLSAGEKDIAYERELRKGVTVTVKLSESRSGEQAKEVASMIMAVKDPQGGRFYVNEYLNVFAPRMEGLFTDYFYCGRINLENWFPEPYAE